MYKKAAKLKLRFKTLVGSLSAEQLFDLRADQLADAIKKVKKILKRNDDDELSFLQENKVIDSRNQLRFEILKDVYLTKKMDEENARNTLEARRHNQRIDNLIAEKKDENLRNMSIEELENLRK